MNIFEIKENAVKKIWELIQEEGNPKLKLRIFVQGGGCAGFSYGFTFEEDKQEEDFIFENKIENFNVEILIDPMSLQYLNGASIDYKEDLMGCEFVINNPNAETTCGCGSSFSI